MRFVNTAILVILLGVVIGIATSGVWSVSLQGVLIMNFVLLATLSIHLLLSLKQIYFRRLFALHTFVVAFAIGCLVAILHNPTSKSNHYTNCLEEDIHYLLQAKVVEKISESDFGKSYKIALFYADNQEVSGDVLCFFQKNIPQKRDLQKDDIFLFTSKLKAIAPPKNLYQFDYKKYMERQGMFWRADVVSFQLTENNSKISSVRGLAQSVREEMFDVLDTNFSKTAASLLKTLLLGERSDLDEDVYQYYIDAGAVHILAISGLHVGIITAILLFFLRKIPNVGIWKKLRLLLLLLFLWSFAFLAGLSPSVVRAVTMFSFVGIALTLNKQQGRFDALILSMLLLLLIHPNYLYEVGFQLSYAAVFSILIFYQRMERWWLPKNKFLKYVWSLLVIGFSAQVVVLPISLYYFHQFPILFFISNLLIVPLLSPLLVLGFLAIIFGFFEILPSFLVFIIEKIIILMNFFAKIVASQEEFIVRHIYFDEKLLISSLIMILFFIYFIYKRNFIRTLSFLGSIILFQGVLFQVKYISEKSRDLAVFHMYKKSLFIMREGKQIIVFQNDTIERNYIANNYAKTLGISDISIQDIPYLFDFQNKTILCLDSLGIYPQTGNSIINSVIVRQSPKINFERMLLKINPEIVIFDGSNYPSYIEKAKKKCDELNIKTHTTSQEGAYLMQSN